MKINEPRPGPSASSSALARACPPGSCTSEKIIFYTFVEFSAFSGVFATTGEKEFSCRVFRFAMSKVEQAANVDHELDDHEERDNHPEPASESRLLKVLSSDSLSKARWTGWIEAESASSSRS